jgi:hypothetical protein
MSEECSAMTPARRNVVKRIVSDTKDDAATSFVRADDDPLGVTSHERSTATALEAAETVMDENRDLLRSFS